MADSFIPLLISGADFAWIVLGLFIMFTALSVVVLSLVWLERKALGRLQRRLGPTRTGPMGLMQPVADAMKLILKEDIIPTSSERAIFWAAPLIVVVSAFMIWVTIPGTQSAVLQNLELGRKSVFESITESRGIPEKSFTAFHAIREGALSPTLSKRQIEQICRN